MKLREVVPVTPQEAATVEVVWRRRGRRRVGFVVALVVGALLVSVLPFREHHQRFLAQRPVLVVDDSGADRWLDLLQGAGIVAEVGPFDLERRDLVIVPAGAGLDDSETASLATWVREGGAVVSPDEPVLSTFSAQVGAERPVEAVRERDIDAARPWPAGVGTHPVSVATDPDAGTAALTGAPATEVLASAGEHALVVRFAYGEGRVLALGWDPAGGDGDALAAVPSLARFIAGAAGRVPVVTRDGVELYFDPALAEQRYGTLDVEAIADRLSIARLVHVAGWYDGTDDASTFDYEGLVDALHDRGVLAGLWLTPPHVSEGMWQRHPQCREKGPTGEDSTLGWRRPIALEDPACFELAWDEVWTPVLGAASWDAVNVADLALAADAGAEPDASRVTRQAELADSMLERITATVDRTEPVRLVLSVSADVDALASVADRHGARLQVDAGAADGVHFDDVTARVAATEGLQRATDAAMLRAPVMGVALARLVATHGAADGRVAVYGFGALEDIDLAGLPRALAADVVVDGAEVHTRFPVRVQSPHPTWRDLRVDGEPYPADGDTAIIPAGRHRVEWRPGESTGRPALVRTSVHLLEAEATATTVELRYEAAGRAFVVFDRRPTRVSVDGARRDLPVHDEAGRFVVEVPDGRRILRFDFGE